MTVSINFDPYDMLIGHDIRIKQLEQQIRELQLNNLQLSKMLEQQLTTIKQCQNNEGVLSEAVGHLLLKIDK